MRKVYVRMDLGSKQRAAVAVNSKGKMVDSDLFKTGEKNIVAFIDRQEGVVHVLVEEGEMALWTCPVSIDTSTSDSDGRRCLISPFKHPLILRRALVTRCRMPSCRIVEPFCVPEYGKARLIPGLEAVAVDELGLDGGKEAL